VVGYHGRIDTTWALSLDRLRDEDPAAVRLLELAAFLAPEPIPLTLFGDHADLLEEPCDPPPPIPTPSPTPSARWSATRWPAASPTASRSTGCCRPPSATS
jgi:hypothetical protein